MSTLTVITPAWISDRGTDVPDWDHPTETDEDWRDPQPLSATEATDMGRQGVVEMLKVIGPPDSKLTSLCRACIAGVVYEVISCVSWPSITGGLNHSKAVLERVRG